MRNQQDLSEAQIYVKIAEHIRDHYPDAIFHFDYGSGTKLGYKQAREQALLNQRSFPDLTIAEAVMMPGTTLVYYGFYLEVKRAGVKLHRTKDQTRISKYDYKVRQEGDWWDAHIEEQAMTIRKLRHKGYVAEFGVGLDDCLQKVDSYMSGHYIPSDLVGIGRTTPNADTEEF